MLQHGSVLLAKWSHSSGGVSAAPYGGFHIPDRRGHFGVSNVAAWAGVGN